MLSQGRVFSTLGTDKKKGYVVRFYLVGDMGLGKSFCHTTYRYKKKTVMWLANTGLEKFHGLKYLPHEALLKKYSHVVGLYMPLYVIWGEKICHTRHI